MDNHSSSSIFLAIKSGLFTDLAFEAIHDERVSKVLNILEKNGENEVDSNGNRGFYVQEMSWDGEHVAAFVRLLQKRPDEYILLEDRWNTTRTPLGKTHGNWQDSVWNPGWDPECGLSFQFIN